MRTHKRFVEVTLKVIVSQPGDEPIVNKVNVAVHEALKRKCVAQFSGSANLGIARGLETFENGAPVDLPSGGVAVVTFQNHYFNGGDGKSGQGTESP